MSRDLFVVEAFVIVHSLRYRIVALRYSIGCAKCKSVSEDVVFCVLRQFRRADHGGAAFSVLRHADLASR
jgi:hypothetical protein